MHLVAVHLAVMEPPTCPHCGSTDLAGVQINGVYDGIVIWCCLGCGVPSPRFPEGDHRHTIAAALIAKETEQ